jgi:hypothetical protein
MKTVKKPHGGLFIEMKERFFMKNTMKCLAIIALVAVIGFSFIACDPADLFGGKDDEDDNKGGGPVTYVSQDNKGNTYTLEIDESGGRSARAAQAGDTFKLTVDYTTAFGGGSLNMKFEYSGTVGDAQVSGATVSLTLDINGETITITIVGTKMTVITGKIVDDDGKEIIDDPGDLTPIEPINPNGAAVTGVSLNRNTLTLTVGAQQTLTATVSPSNAANKNVSWSSSNSSVASVMYGLVKGESAGTATITVTTADGNKQASCTVTVTGGDIGGNTFTTIPEFNTWLGNQPVNTKETAYNVNINISNLGGTSSTSSSLGGVLRNRSNKYVNINLSGSTITAIPSDSFASCSTLAGVTIGGSVTSIGNNAFYPCVNLTSVTILNSVTSIGSQAFRGCTSLTSVTMGSGVTNIGSSAFYGCTLLTSVTIGSSVTSIGSEAFRNCTSLAGIIIPNSVTSIGANAFQGCTTLTSVTIPNSVTSIGNYAFSGCTILPNVVIPNSVTSIGNRAFENCTILTSVTFTATSKVASIGGAAFYGCTNLASIVIPNSVTSIGSNAFENCTNLTSATIGSGVATISSYAFLGCTNLASVTFLGTVSSISYTNAFPGDLRAKYLANNGGPGRYTRAGNTWTKQSS